jgi:hypothetical protein
MQETAAIKIQVKLYSLHTPFTEPPGHAMSAFKKPYCLLSAICYLVSGGLSLLSYHLYLLYSGTILCDWALDTVQFAETGPLSATPPPPLSALCCLFFCFMRPAVFCLI